MGTAIVATLTETLGGPVAGGRSIAVVFLVLAWGVLLGLTVAFAGRVLRSPGALGATVSDVAALTSWGMVAMGVVSVGAATATVVPAHRSGLIEAAWLADGVLWVIGTTLGVVTALGFGMRLVGREAGAPTTTWGLPLVPPMVSATAGAALVPHVASRAARLWLVVGLVGCFLLALSLAIVVFAVAYHHHWRVAPLPLAASATAWLPLGVVGQSVAAAQAIAARAEAFVLPADVGTVQRIADVYGVVVLAAGAPLAAWAAFRTAVGLVRGMPFSPSWWAMTFPVGTLCLGAHALATGTGAAPLNGVATAALVALLGTWTLCAAATVRAVAPTLVRRRARRPDRSTGPAVATE